MSISPMKQLLEDAAAHNRAVGAFNVGNMEMILGVIRAAEELNTPVILQIAEARLNHSPLSLMGPMMVAAARKSKVKTAVHLDHGRTEETVRKALDLGFSSVMFDGSRYEYAENLRLTSRVTAMARAAGASMEAELGVVGGSESSETGVRAVCTDPERARDFSEQTGVDALAVAIGNAHGHYVAEPKLRFDVLEEIHKTVKVPLVLHGGTGISPEDFRKCVRHGIRKINITTADFDALTRGAERCFRTGEACDYFKLNESMVREVYETVKTHILIFNNQVPLERINGREEGKKIHAVHTV